MTGGRVARWVGGVAVYLMTTTPAYGVQTTVGGRTVDLDATLSLREVVEENGSTTHDRTQEQLRLRAGVSLAQWLRFDSVTIGTNGGPTMKADRSGIYNLRDVFQDVSPAAEFDEAYFDVYLPSVDLRLGKQKVAWGKLDRFQPNDFLNPLSYSDPFLLDEAERKIGVPAVQASYYLPEVAWLPAESRVTTVWVPQYVPYRFPTARCDVDHDVSRCSTERWFPPAATPPQTFTVPAGVIPLGNGMFNPPITVPLSFRVQNEPSPSWRFENNEIGLRYSGIVRDVDTALYYYHGFDNQPAFHLGAAAVGVPDASKPLGVDALSGATTLTPQFRHIDAGGADAAYAVDRFTFRGEAAYISGRPFTHDLRFLITDPSSLDQQLARAVFQLAHGAGSVPIVLPQAFVQRDAVEWGVGGDYLYEGYLLLLQVNQTDVRHSPGNLLIKDVETRFLVNLRKSFLADTLQTQLIAGHALESDYTYVRPRLLYRVTDNVDAEVGYIFIAGRAQSTIGQYRRNDEGWVRLAYKL